ncbi:hypothetical protein BJV78DRAFT_1219985 [Lactifluus subvellereus]|nr:hypothetical protein BJV78DRAFT_1219985 [Lactifluus subvellereus]
MGKNSSTTSDSFLNKKRDVFDPHDRKTVQHRKIGVWDLYVERDKLLSYFPTSWKIETYVGMWNDVPYLCRAIRDMCTIAWPLLLLYLVLTLAKSLLPALTFFPFLFVSQVQIAVEKHTVDTRSLFQVVGGRTFCAAAQHFLEYTSHKASRTLNRRFKQLYSTHIFHAMASARPGQINALFPNNRHPYSTAWGAIMPLVDTVSAFLRLFSQTAILFCVLREQRDGQLLALLSFASDLASYFDMQDAFYLSRAWAATTRIEDFIKMEGLKLLVSKSHHRKELVAGGLSEYLTAEYRALADRVGRHASGFWSAVVDSGLSASFGFRCASYPRLSLPFEQSSNRRRSRSHSRPSILCKTLRVYL